MSTVSIVNLFSGFSDYISHSIVATNQKAKELSITYVYKMYDLIDKDLDFDEAYYEKIMVNLRAVLFEECKELLNASEFTNVTITCCKLVMRDDIKMEHQIYLDEMATTTTSYV